MLPMGLSRIKNSYLHVSAFEKIRDKLFNRIILTSST